jgi:hypothetical protein
MDNNFSFFNKKTVVAIIFIISIVSLFMLYWYDFNDRENQFLFALINTIFFAYVYFRPQKDA